MSWLGNGRLLTSWAAFVPFGPFLIPFPVPVTVDVTSAKVDTLLPKKAPYRAGAVIWTAPDGSSVLLSATRNSKEWPEVLRVDLASGLVTTVQASQSPILAWFADANGVVRAGIGRDGKHPAIFYRTKADEPLRRSTPPPPPKGKADDGGDDMLETIRFDGPGNTKLAISNRQTGRFSVYEYDLEHDTFGKALFEHPKVDVDRLVIDAGGYTVSGIAYEDDRPRVKWLDAEQGRLQAQIDRIFPNTVNTMTSRSQDGNLVVVETMGPDSAGMSYLFDRKARIMKGLLPAFDNRETLHLSPVRAFDFKARDGLEIPGYLTLPVGKATKALPLIVMPHGGPFARDRWGYDPYVQFLASRGYAVLQPQFRGSTGFGRSFVEKGYGQWGAAMQDDLLDGIAALAREGTIDPKRVCIVGISYGGYAAEWGAARDAAHYRCAISLAGVSDIRAQLRHDRSLFYAPRYAAAWAKKVEGEEKRDLDAFSPLQQQTAITIPLLIAHGEADNNVPANQSHQLVKALQRRNATVEGLFYKGEGHGLTDAKNQADFLSHVEAFLAKYNPA
ncbi:alpha/beta hydrolase family protein [Sphingomonas crusticola]|uniref:alpha/beta hydrolase family protein n=1 Tax=Sphingomonas crusticola TaxID=1697973 RepID=UPI0013C3554C|nr:alpha/beta fold hydrolase [Sphingomonas crusticola]